MNGKMAVVQSNMLPYYQRFHRLPHPVDRGSGLVYRIKFERISGTLIFEMKSLNYQL
jgi:hypothetical protein